MDKPVIPASLADDLLKVREFYGRMLERRDGLVQRDAEIVGEVGTAKSRQLLHPQVGQFLDRLQSDANAKTVGSYEKLLTAIVQDVFGRRELSVRLEIYTERGLPALDIKFSQGGNVLDIYESAGGSLTNVVCLGLRAIATVKARMRPFLMLDEPDYWMEPEKIEPFFKILKQMSDRMKFQCLVVTHHTVGTFGFPFTHIKLNGRPDLPQGVTAEVRPGGPQWQDAESQGIRGITFKNHAAYADMHIPLGPGLNILTGANMIGKSRTTRGLRGVFYGGQNESTDDDIRIGQNRSDIEVHFERGRTLYYSREKKRNPVCEWRMTEADGRVATAGGKECHGRADTKGLSVPSWMPEATGIGLVDGLDLQIMHQKKAPFLLSEKPAARAAVLSIGREASWIRNMIQKHRDDVTRDNNTVKRGEAELAQIRQRLSRAEGIDEIGTAITKLVADLETLKNMAADTDIMEAAGKRVRDALAAHNLENGVAAILAVLSPPPDISASVREAQLAEQTAHRVSLLRSALDSLKHEIAILDGLPLQLPVILPSEPTEAAAWRMIDAAKAAALAYDEADILDQLPGAVPEMVPIDQITAAADKILSSRAAARLARATAKILETLPADMAVLPFDQTGPATAAARVRTARLAVEQSKAMEREIDASIAAAALAVANALESAGNHCPLCGSHTSADHVLAHVGSGGKEAA